MNIPNRITLDTLDQQPIGEIIALPADDLALLQAEVEARHVAEAFVMLARAERTTGHVMTVDGGNIEAALR